MDVSSIQVQLGNMQRREATIEALKLSLATKMAAVEAALLAAQSSNSDLTALQDTFTAVTDSQFAMEATLGTLADDVDRVDGRVTSSSSNAGNTRAVVQSLLQQLVHPEATWNEGTGEYTIPEGAVPLYQAIQDQVTSLDSRVSGTDGSLISPIFELDASVLGGELGRLITEWPSIGSSIVANSMGTATPRLYEDGAGGVPYVRLGPEHGYFLINGFQLDSTTGHTITMVVRNHSGSLGPASYPIPFHAYVEAHDNGWGMFINTGTTKDLYYKGPNYPWEDREFLGDGLIFAGMEWVVLSLVVSEEKTEVFKNGISVYSVARTSPLPPSDPHTIVTIGADKAGISACNLDVAFFSASQGALDNTAVVALQNNLQTRLGAAGSSEDLVVRSDGLTPDPNLTAFDWGDTSAVHIAFSSPLAGNFSVATGGGLNGDQVGLKLNSSDWDAQLRMASDSYPYNLMSQAVFVQMTFQSQTLYYSNDYPQILSYGENASDLFSLHMGHSSARAPTLTLKNSSGWTWTHELISPSDYSSFANTTHELLIAMSFDAGTSTLRYRVRAESASSTHAQVTTTTQGTRSSTTETFAAALGAYVPRLGGLDEPMQGGAFYHSVQVYKDPLTDAEFDAQFDAYYPAVEVFDSSSGELRLNFVIDNSTDTVYAVGTPTGDITHDTQTHSLVLPATSSQIVKAPSQPHASYNHTWYMVLSLAQHTATQMLWEHGPLSLKLNQFNSIVLTGDHSTISTMINLSGSGAAYPPIDTPFVVTWYYGNDGMYVLINGTHVWSSPKSHSWGYSNEIGTEGRLMGSGTSGRLYDLRMYSTKHDDLEINDTIQAIATELTIDLSTQIAFP